MFDAVSQMHYGNAIGRPILASIHRLPWAADAQFRVGQVLCETFWPPHYRDGAPQSACPRYVARRQLTTLQKLGYRLKSGFEAEFAFYRTEDGTAPLFDGKGVYVSQCLAKVEPLLYALESGLAASGVDVLTLQTERGPGQLELALAPKFDGPMRYSVSARPSRRRAHHGVCMPRLWRSRQTRSDRTACISTTLCGRRTPNVTSSALKVFTHRLYSSCTGEHTYKLYCPDSMQG